MAFSSIVGSHSFLLRDSFIRALVLSLFAFRYVVACEILSNVFHAIFCANALQFAFAVHTHIFTIANCILVLGGFAIAMPVNHFTPAPECVTKCNSNNTTKEICRKVCNVRGKCSVSENQIQLYAELCGLLIQSMDFVFYAIRWNANRFYLSRRFLFHSKFFFSVSVFISLFCPANSRIFGFVCVYVFFFTNNQKR